MNEKESDFLLFMLLLRTLYHGGSVVAGTDDEMGKVLEIRYVPFNNEQVIKAELTSELKILTRGLGQFLTKVHYNGKHQFILNKGDEEDGKGI